MKSYKLGDESLETDFNPRKLPLTINFPLTKFELVFLPKEKIQNCKIKLTGRFTSGKVATRVKTIGALIRYQIFPRKLDGQLRSKGFSSSKSSKSIVS